MCSGDDFINHRVKHLGVVLPKVESAAIDEND
jgi:hypothetical protein